MSANSYILDKKRLAKLLEVTVPGLRTWFHEGAPLRADLSGDPLEVIDWYLGERPCLSMQWTAMWRLENYPAIARRIRRERRKRERELQEQA